MTHKQAAALVLVGGILGAGRKEPAPVTPPAV